MNCAIADCALAHQKWLWPNAFAQDAAPAWVSFDVSWSDQPFTAGQGVGEQLLTIVGPDGNRSTPTAVFAGKTKTTAEFELTKAGTYRLEAADAPTYWTRIDAGGKEQWIKKPKTEVSSGKITRADFYYSEAIAYVTVGSTSELPTPDVKDPLEIALKTHPARITAGEEIELQVLSYGKPVENARINLFGPTTAGHDPEQMIDANKDGVARLKFAGPGRRLLSCDMERPVKDDPKTDMHSFHAYLTLSVAEAKP
jgi:uncharacterized GH25 family protein